MALRSGDCTVPVTIGITSPPTGFSEVLERNKYCLFIHVAGGGHASSSSAPGHGVLCYYFIEHLPEWSKFFISISFSSFLALRLLH